MVKYSEYDVNNEIDEYDVNDEIDEYDVNDVKLSLT
jgi:hypothetical protein